MLSKYTKDIDYRDLDALKRFFVHLNLEQKQLTTDTMYKISIEELDIVIKTARSSLNIIDKLIYENTVRVPYKCQTVLADIRHVYTLINYDACFIFRDRKIQNNKSFNNKVLCLGAYTDCHESFKKTASGHFKGIRGITL